MYIQNKNNAVYIERYYSFINVALKTPLTLLALLITVLT